MSKVKMTLELPKVGDELMRCMNPYSCNERYLYVPLKCKVVYVNEEHKWYKVKFEGLDIEECFGVPVFDHSVIDRNKVKQSGIPVVCWETGTAYSTVRECARDLHIDYTNVLMQLSGVYKQIKGYHFSPLV